MLCEFDASDVVVVIVGLLPEAQTCKDYPQGVDWA